MIGCDGMIALARGLKLNNTLKFLSLKYCGIQDKGGHALCEVLSFARTALECLDLEGNPLGGKGLYHISSGLKINSTLQKLTLADICISRIPLDIVSIKLFGDAIGCHKALNEVNFSQNNIGESGGLELLNCVKGNNKIQTLLVDSCLLPSEIYSALSRKPVKKKHGKNMKKRKKKKPEKK